MNCTKEYGVEKCCQCSKFPCKKIVEMLQRTEEYKKICKERCTEEEYRGLEKAFFAKEVKLRK